MDDFRTLWFVFHYRVVEQMMLCFGIRLPFLSLQVNEK